MLGQVLRCRFECGKFIGEGSQNGSYEGMREAGLVCDAFGRKDSTDTMAAVEKNGRTELSQIKARGLSPMTP